MRLKLILLFSVVLFSGIAFSQDLLTSSRKSPYTYVYKVFPQNKFKIKELRNPVDSFPTGGFFQRRLKPGYYVLQHIEDEFVKYSYVYVPSFSAYSLNNSLDFVVKLVDSSGKAIDDADVRIRHRVLKFDNELQAYVFKDWKLPGRTLTITYNGETASYTIEGYGLDIRLSLKQRLIRTLSLQKRYFTYWYWRRVYYRYKHYFENLPWVIKDKLSRHFRPVIITNKPVYHRGDTLFFKVLAVNKKGRPARFKTTLYIDRKKIKTVRPSGKGIYTGWVVLSDSIVSQNKRYYTFSLRHGKHSFSKHFQCYDYELNEAKLSVRADKKIRYRNEDLILFVKATDYNGLNLPNAKVTISINTQSIDKVFEDYLFIPKVLWQKQLVLNNIGETKITVPADAFPQANFKFSVIVSLLYKGKRISKTLYITNLWEKREVCGRLAGDSVVFEYSENGRSLPLTGTLYRITEQNKYLFSTEHFNGKLFPSVTVKLPYKEKVDQNVLFYYFVSDSLKQVISPDAPKLMIKGYRTKDSIFITIDNPSKIRFQYAIYRLDKELARGYADSLAFSERNHRNKNYYVYVSYYWAGREYELKRKFGVRNKYNIKLDVDAPKVVYPGQKAEITLRVTDIKGRPVRNADITAYSLKSAFRPSPPYTFYKPYIVDEKSFDRYFGISRKKLPSDGRKLINSPKYFKRYGLDTIEFYRFLNPKPVYRYETPAKDSSTVFAVYVTENGHTLNTKYIELNNKPVYFYFVNDEPYMFNVEPDVKYTLKILTDKYLVILRDVSFKKGMKTILSINVRARQNKHFQVFENDNSFDAKYEKFVRNHTIGYVNSFLPTAFVKQESRYFLLNTSGYLGPLMPEQNAELTVMPNYSRQFSVEPGYKYIFDQKSIRLKPLEFSEPKLTRRKINFYVYPWRRSDFDFLYKKYLYNQRKRIKFGISTVKPTSDVHIELSDLQPDAINFILFSQNSFSVFPPQKSIQAKFAPNERYNLLILYKNGYYQIFKNLVGQDGGKTFYRLTDDRKYINDYSIRLDSLLLYVRSKDTAFYDTVRRLVWQINRTSPGIGIKASQIAGIQDIKPKYIIWGQVRGVVKDKNEGTPIPGCSVTVKGANIGTITNVDGMFVLDNIAGEVTLVIDFVGYETKEITAMPGDFLEVELEPMPLELQEVVVTALGVKTKSHKNKQPEYGLTQKVEVQTGNEHKTKPKVSAIDGYPLITSDQYENLALSPRQIKKITFYPPQKAYEKFRISTNGGISEILLISGDKLFVYGPVSLPATVADTALMHSSLRHNFRDYAFWQPTLRTDRRGQVRFTVTFPDDITQWTNFFVAYKPGKNGKVVRTTTKSYKPVMARLDLPRFLIKHDKSFFFGTTTTYLNDTISFKTEFYINDSLALSRKHKTDFSVTDTLYYRDKGTDDSVSFTYKMVKDDGYFDGEQRKIPVLPMGAELTRGSFYKLDKDTTIIIPRNALEGTTNIFATSSRLDLILYEAQWVAGYRYYCNEQLASELLALLTMRKIAEFKHLKNKYDRNINVIIRKLRKRMNGQGLWGWWGESHTVDWISMHVLRALREAERQGFNTGLEVNNQKMVRDFIDEFDRTRNINRKIDIINYLQLLGYEYFDPKEFAYSILNDTTVKLSAWQKFRLYHILSSLGEQIPVGEIMRYKKETLFGNYYFEYPGKDVDVDKNTLTFTLLAYKILRNAHAGDDTLRQIRNYLFENYGKTQWYNTYLKSSVFSVILPDLIKESGKEVYPSLTFSGGYVKTVNKFPFSDTISVTDDIKITKTGTYPVYLTLYNRRWVTTPKSNNEYFTISTEIGGQAGSVVVLKQDSLYRLVTKVEVKKPIKYVMLSIPIPAGCVYTAQPRGKYHRIYQKDRVLIFARSLEPGTYRFSVPLTAHYKGTYTLNPAKIELMYFPTFYGNNRLKTVIIKRK